MKHIEVRRNCISRREETTSDEQNSAENKFSNQDRQHWIEGMYIDGISISFEILTLRLHVEDEMEKSEADSRSSQNANLKAHNQLVGLWFNKQRKILMTIFDS